MRSHEGTVHHGQSEGSGRTAPSSSRVEDRSPPRSALCARNEASSSDRSGEVPGAERQQTAHSCSRSALTAHRPTLSPTCTRMGISTIAATVWDTKLEIRTQVSSVSHSSSTTSRFDSSSTACTRAKRVARTDESATRRRVARTIQRRGRSDRSDGAVRHTEPEAGPRRCRVRTAGVVCSANGALEGRRKVCPGRTPHRPR